MTASPHSGSWDETIDLLVIGSGAGGMSAALRGHSLGLQTIVVDAASQYGGNTAMSGGVCWVADNADMPRVGISDSIDDGLRYLQHITEAQVADERLLAYLHGSKRMLGWMQENSHLRFDAIRKYPDYYAEAPGGRPGGRSMESRPFDGAQLGKELSNLRDPHPQSQILGKFGITAGQAQTLIVNNWRSKVFLMWCFLRFALRSHNRKKYGRDTALTTGNALCARLRRSMLDRDIPLWLSAPAQELVIRDGRVVGAVVQLGAASLRIRARRGVVLAAGGFSRNRAMREANQRHPISDQWTAGCLENMGAGIRMGIAAGGAVELMDEAWWTPVTQVPGSESAWVLVVEKSLPGSILVNQEGRRFANEAAPYIDVVNRMYDDQAKTGASVPCYLVFDATFRRNYPCGPVPPGYAVPDGRLPRRYRDGFFTKADTLGDLAQKLGIGPQTLVDTVDRFNRDARAGEDTLFGRGKTLSGRYYGDPRVKPNPCLAPISDPPFYAIPVFPGDLGTKGGLVTDTGSRVLNKEGQAIKGLYATGNCTASVMGRSYPGAGGTIGPALTFGMIAAESAARDATSDETE